ncbi:MAG: hypothetical protein IJQ60_00360 [Prevotella sp.]|nr:hypothetical protein [Prevotella sp.]
MADLGDDRRQHLAFIQDVITRMNSNSFSLKGLMITIVAALGALTVNDDNRDTAVFNLAIALLLVLIFWFLDAYYLKMERQYRLLYEAAVKDKAELYKMKADDYYVCYFEVLFSKTMWPLYLFMAVVLIVALFII